MERATLPMVIKVGESFYFTAARTDDAGVAVNLTGCTSDLSIRRTYGGAVLASGSTTDGRITISGVAGLVTVEIPPAVTATLTAGQYLSDLKLTYPSGRVEYLADIQLQVDPRVTE
jgi:hypothetical protein